MINGLTVDLTAGELARLLEERIDHHREIADDCDSRRVRLQAVATIEHDGPSVIRHSDPDDDPEDTEKQLAVAWPPYLQHLERRAERHRSRAAALQFVRDHLSAHEIYRLGEVDLEALHLWPEDTLVRAGEGDEA